MIFKNLTIKKFDIFIILNMVYYEGINYLAMGQTASSFQTINIIKIVSTVDSQNFSLGSSQNFSSNIITQLSQLGLSLKYYDPNDIYNIIKKNIKKVEKENESYLVEKYGLIEDMENHPEIEKIRQECKICDLTWSHGYNSTSSFMNADKLFRLEYTEKELEAISEIYSNDITPLTFIRSYKKNTDATVTDTIENNNDTVNKNDNDTILCFVTFSNDKKFLNSITIHLKFDLFSTDCAIEAQKESFLKVINDSLTRLNTMEPKQICNTTDKIDSLSFFGCFPVLACISLLLYLSLTFIYEKI